MSNIITIYLNKSKIVFSIINRTTKELIDASSAILQDEKRGDNKWKEIISMVKRYLSEKDINFDKSVLILSEEYFFFRYLTFPFIKWEHISKAVPLEMNRLLPLKGEDLIYRFIVLEQGKKDSKVMALAIKKDIIEKIISCFKEAGVKLELITIDVVILGSYLSTHEKDNFLLLWANNNYTRIICPYKDMFLYGKSCHLSLKADIIYGEMLPHCFLDCPELSTSKIIFYPNLPDNLSKLGLDSNISVEYISFLDIIKNNGVKVSSFTGEELICVLASFVSSKKLPNFSPGARTIPLFYILDKYFHSFFFYLIIICSLVTLQLVSSLSLLKEEDNNIRLQIEHIVKKNFPSISKSLAPIQYPSIFRERINQLKSNMLDTHKNHKVSNPLILLEKISEAIPQGIDFTIINLYYNSNVFQIKGITNSFENVGKIKESLENISYFKKITIRGAVWDSLQKKVSFSLSIVL